MKRVKLILPMYTYEDHIGLVASKPDFVACNSQCVDQPVLLRSLITTFVIRSLERKIATLTTCEISIFELVSVAKEAGLSLSRSQTPNTCFLATWSICYLKLHSL